jgi:uncharacterized membrane protein
MATIEESVDVEVPVGVAYDQWTQFESFPQFMEGVKSVRQLDDTHNHWVTEVGGVRREFDTVITEQLPDERIAWRTTGGDVRQAGVVTFHQLGDRSTRVMIQIDWDPDGVVERAGDAIGADDRRVKGDAERFKQFIEDRGHQTGAWRGSV